ncbi:Homoaconitase/3-isopropylmalate dehydratase, large subunit, subgroup [Candidatus Omnitrophus magneticus]|uniref:3-isopropylmalate dehydratase large subunit n=1 Tax=Candidatus Omnitrophus magneticus TaxID=1609969 RepID=A0A0F0CTF6_9BACT|nr:Homoaconitase/3-isopropylmalate dehydratase, large subunit, subgroup [Candidatus Omnitrophus magneticus]
MGYTITEKILKDHASGVKNIAPGDFIMAKVDFCFGNDITAPIAISEFKKLGKKGVFNKNAVGLIPDHFLPAKDIMSANQAKILKDFAKEYSITNYFELGQMGVEHALLPERALVLPGDVIIGADSHTCTHGALGAFATGVGSTDLAYVMAFGECWFRVPETIKIIFKGKLKKWVGGKDLILHVLKDLGVSGAAYKTFEFTGSTISSLSMDDRFSMCNMAIEGGAKNGIIAPDKITQEYVKKAIKKYKPFRKRFKLYESDKDAKYADVREYNVSKLEPLVAAPHLPSNVQSIADAKGIKVDQVVIGSCTNGRLSDLKQAAAVLRNRKINTDTRLIVIPATPAIYAEAVKLGYAEIFVKAGGVFCTPTCGPCLGGHMGILAEGEIAIATTNRNFVGRMGHPKSFIYLANPAIAAASAVKGKIAHPSDL